MKTTLSVAILGLMFLVGCTYDFVSVSRDGTIALTLDERGDFEPGEGCVYLTNADAEFLTRIEALEECWSPAISPSGKSIAAVSDEGLLLYERKTEKRRVIYRNPRTGDHQGPNFPAWSPDEKKIAFLVGDLEDDPPDWKLCVYDVKRRELEVLARRACPRIAWLPDSKRLLYLSFPADASASDGGQFGDLKMINVKTGRHNMLARRQLLAYSKVAVFPNGKAALFPCVTWDYVELSRAGIEVPLGLRKELLSGPGKKAPKRKRDKAEEEEPAEPEETGAKPDAEEAPPALSEEKPEEEGFFLTQGQPFCYFACAVSPDGKGIAYVRYLWDVPPDEPGAVEEEETGSGKAENVEDTTEEPEEAVEDDEPKGLEFCVAKADGNHSVAVLRSMGEDLFPQVLWVSNTRLLCVTVSFDEESHSEITLVDADGKNKLDLIEAIKEKFADQFKEEQKDEMSTEEASESP
jgi:hypothetical protein